ncbi:hypothetical protein DY000_02029698 [Brassica cretica]|uniref:Uncharacterized protein n=1 Tax=Brassica cretica TaxID=69181 RepID=A0ABQ7DIQ8_BRACR|nr:hypothetical protein DY000_02029698 [Brassica cretica]
MFYGVCGEHERNKAAFQIKLDGVYYPLNDSISWLTTCMEEMKQDIAKLQNSTDVARPPSIDRRRPQSIDSRQSPSIDRHHHTSIDNRLTASIDTNPPRPHMMKSQPDFHTREKIDQLVEAIQGELVKIQSYIARRPEAALSIDRRNNKSIDIHNQTSIDTDTNRGRLVPKKTSDMSNTPYHGEEISADTYAALTRHQFNLESLGDRLQRIENTTAAMKDKWRIGDEAMRDFTGTWNQSLPPTLNLTQLLVLGLGMHGIGFFKQVWNRPSTYTARSLRNDRALLKLGRYVATEHVHGSVATANFSSHSNALVPVDFHVLDIKLNWNSSLLLGRAFLSTVGVVSNLQTNQLCLTLIDPNAHYDLIPVKKPQTIPRRINDPGIIAACHCGVEYESDYSKSIDTHPVTSINASHPKSTYVEGDESVDTYPDEWENDYYNPLLMLTPNALSIDMTSWPSIDTQPQQRCRKHASTDSAYYKSVDTDFNRVRDGDYSIGSWADEHHHESFVLEIATNTPGANKLQDSFTDEELLNMQKRDDTYQIQAEAAWERTRFSQSVDARHQQSIDTLPQQSIDTNNTTSIDNHPIPKTTVSEKDKLDNQYLAPDEFGIFRDPDGYAKAIDGRTLHESR